MSIYTETAAVSEIMPQTFTVETLEAMGELAILAAPEIPETSSTLLGINKQLPVVDKNEGDGMTCTKHNVLCTAEACLAERNCEG